MDYTCVALLKGSKRVVFVFFSKLLYYIETVVGTTAKETKRQFELLRELKNFDEKVAKEMAEDAYRERSRDENQQQTQPTYDPGSGNRIRATLVRSRSALTTALSLLMEGLSP